MARKSKQEGKQINTTPISTETTGSNGELQGLGSKYSNPPGISNGGHDFDTGDRFAIYKEYADQMKNPGVDATAASLINAVSDDKPAENVAEDTEATAVQVQVQEKEADHKDEENINTEFIKPDIASNKESAKSENIPADEGLPPLPEFNKDKTVPAGALREEREKRKKLNSEIEEIKKSNTELSEQMKQLIADNRRLMEKIGSNTTSTQPDTDQFKDDDIVPYGEVKKLRDEFVALKKDNENIRQRFQTDEQNKIQERINRDIERVEKDLIDEGINGFKTFGIPKVKEYLINLKRQEDDGVVDPGTVEAYDTPKGWRRIYKDVIYPELYKVFAKQDKSQLMQLKKEIKGNANLVSSHGAKQDKAPETKEWSYADYMKHRQVRELG